MKKIAIWSLFAIGNVMFSFSYAQTFNAKTYFFNTVEVNAPISERIKKIHVKEGQKVKKGDLLIELDDAIRKQDYLIAKAKLAEIEPNFKLTSLDYELAQEQYDRTLLSDVDLKKAQFKYQVSKAKLDSAQAEAEKAKWLLDSTKIISPINGRVLSIPVSEGFYFSLQVETRPLVTLINDQNNFAKANLKTSEWNESLLKKQATVTINNKKYKGKVEYISVNPIKMEKGVNLYPFVVSFKSPRFFPSGIPASISIK